MLGKSLFSSFLPNFPGQLNLKIFLSSNRDVSTSHWTNYYTEDY